MVFDDGVAMEFNDVRLRVTAHDGVAMGWDDGVAMEFNDVRWRAMAPDGMAMACDGVAMACDCMCNGVAMLCATALQWHATALGWRAAMVCKLRYLRKSQIWQSKTTQQPATRICKDEVRSRGTRQHRKSNEQDSPCKEPKPPWTERQK